MCTSVLFSHTFIFRANCILNRVKALTNLKTIFGDMTPWTFKYEYTLKINVPEIYFIMERSTYPDYWTNQTEENHNTCTNIYYYFWTVVMFLTMFRFVLFQYEDQPPSYSTALWYSNLAFVIIFSIEAALKIFVLRKVSIL